MHQRIGSKLIFFINPDQDRFKSSAQGEPSSAGALICMAHLLHRLAEGEINPGGDDTVMVYSSFS